ncbi:chorismate mutase [uncultured Jatrophihabitans sp.]|uniref:chorismate mutase n=1 Tax=uncultured Jatrophihabitans sp. TaxID=1610747 RepID=UPI0035CA81C0
MSTPTLTGDTAQSGESIDMLRAQIDAMDEAIIRLVSERAKLSARVQRARMNAGGTRVQLGRERVIMDAYRTGLGQHGPAVADAVLGVCRGSR